MATVTSAKQIDELWVGEPFAPVFDRNMHATLALLFAAVGLVYAGKFSITKKDLAKETLFAAVSSVTLGLAAVLTAQACGLYV
ncbi:hypothetical protein EC988_004039 [Linderina pennispora]|nr:hypothetical protein EC988_004039 [Linderina pennispora]